MKQVNKKANSSRRGKSLLFKAIALLLPFMLLVLLEAGLRLLNYGNDLGLFVEDKENVNYWVMNTHASERYFTNTENATIGVFESFRKVKVPGTLRIFVLGESTTLGYPYMASASFDRWLYYRLMHTFPNRDFEIVNLSLTAVNSYTVLGFTKEIVNYQPDAVMIYCGQNEYYGALGVGSTSQLGRSRILVQSLLYARSLRLVQLVENTFSKIKKSITSHQVDTNQTLMQRMAARQEISFSSSLYSRGIAQFKSNMEDVCKRLSSKGIPVFISNLVSNERDQKPFISSKKDTIDSADYQYTKAQKAYAMGDFATAKQKYVLAKELDLLRFRAPEALNSIIASLPQKFPGIFMVDTKEVFEDHSPHGIIGQETMLEHVHPTIYGYGLMSEAFYQGLKQHQIITPDVKSEIPFDQLQHQMPVTIVDSLKGAYQIMLLKEKWPFNEPVPVDFNQLNTFEDQLALSLLYQKTTWIRAMRTQIDHYSTLNDQVNVLKVAEASVLQVVNNAYYLYYVGQLCLEQGINPKAKVYLQHAFKLSPRVETAQKLAILFLKDDQPEMALPYLIYLQQSDSSRPVYANTILLAKNIIEYKNKLNGDTGDVGIMNQIAMNYFKMQNNGCALQYAEKAFALDKSNKETSKLIGKIKSIAPSKLK